jgi:phosphoribosylcarboxyaminoimidazole (NCAIR) mutase
MNVNVQLLQTSRGGRVVVLMGSYDDDATGMKICDVCETYGIECHVRVTSVHKGPDATLKLIAEYEGTTNEHEHWFIWFCSTDAGLDK